MSLASILGKLIPGRGNSKGKGKRNLSNAPEQCALRTAKRSMWQGWSEQGRKGEWPVQRQGLRRAGLGPTVNALGYI